MALDRKMNALSRKLNNQGSIRRKKKNANETESFK